MSRFREALHSGRVLLMDGAMGTELQRAGLKEGECYEAWNRTHPEQVRAIHRGYVYAGARCLLTNTFQANPESLANHGRREELEAICRDAVALARSVCGVNHFVLGAIGPTQWREEGFAAVVQSLRSADALLLETWSGDQAPFAASQRVRQLAEGAEGLPVLLSLTFRLDEGRLGRPVLHGIGLEPERVAVFAQQSGVDVLGVNCGRDIGMDETIEVVRRYRQATDLPLLARPNAGTPKCVGDRWVYPWTPEVMAARLPELLEAGISLVGGCCGTTPDHIAAFRPIIDAWNARRQPKEPCPPGEQA